MENNFEFMLDLEKFRYMQCPHCNGYGSSLKAPGGMNICKRCGESGLIKNEKGIQMTITVEIYSDDLTPEKQGHWLKAFKTKED